MNVPVAFDKNTDSSCDHGLKSDASLPSTKEDPGASPGSPEDATTTTDRISNKSTMVTGGDEEHPIDKIMSCLTTEMLEEIVAFGHKKNRGKKQVFGIKGGKDVSSGPMIRTPEAEKVDGWVEIVQLVNGAKRLLSELSVGKKVEKAADHVLLMTIFQNHPTYAKKVGSGVASFKLAYSATASRTKCFFVVRSDGSEEDFSYHECLLNKASQMKPPLSDRYKKTYLSSYSNQLLTSLDEHLQKLEIN